MEKHVSMLSRHILNGYLAWFYENDISPINVRIIGALCSAPAVKSRISPDGTIILNLSPTATRELAVDEEGVSFKTRFDGLDAMVFFPYSALISIRVPLGDGASVELPFFEPALIKVGTVEAPIQEPKPTRPTLVVVK